MYCPADNGSEPWSCAPAGDNAGVKVHRARADLHFRQAGKNSTLIAAAIPPGPRYAPVRRRSDGRCQTGKKWMSFVNTTFLFLFRGGKFKSRCKVDCAIIYSGLKDDIIFTIPTKRIFLKFNGWIRQYCYRGKYLRFTYSRHAQYGFYFIHT